MDAHSQICSEVEIMRLQIKFLHESVQALTSSLQNIQKMIDIEKSQTMCVPVYKYNDIVHVQHQLDEFYYSSIAGESKHIILVKKNVWENNS